MLSTPRLAGVLALFLLGCGAPPDGFTPVRGKVSYQGKPLGTGVVILTADTARGNKTAHEPRGTIDENGTYQVTTAGKPGAPPGWYKVGVVCTRAKNDKNLYAIPDSLIPKHYGEPEKSKLAIEVVDKPAAGAYDLDLK
jgi:hypothetical protein